MVPGGRLAGLASKAKQAACPKAMNDLHVYLIDAAMFPIHAYMFTCIA